MSNDTHVKVASAEISRSAPAAEVGAATAKLIHATLLKELDADDLKSYQAWCAHWKVDNLFAHANALCQEANDVKLIEFAAWCRDRATYKVVLSRHMSQERRAALFLAAQQSACLMSGCVQRNMTTIVRLYTDAVAVWERADKLRSDGKSVG